MLWELVCRSPLCRTKPECESLTVVPGDGGWPVRVCSNTPMAEALPVPSNVTVCH